MNNQPNLKSIKPKAIRIQVRKNDILTTNMRIPYFALKMGVKIGKIIDKSNKGNVDTELERLKDIDRILEALNYEEISLPYLLVEVDEGEKKDHVTITLE